MKKSMIKFVLAMFFAVESVFLSAQQITTNSSHQILIPNTIYTGDTAELKYIFQTEAAFLPGNYNSYAVEIIELSTDFRPFNEIEEKCFVSRVILEKNISEYTLTLTIIPWATGNIDFPPFDLCALISKSLQTETTSSLTVDFSPFAVNSLTKKLNVTEMCAPSPPLLMPGTTGILVLFFIIILALAGAVIFVILKIPEILIFCRDSKTKRFFRALKKKTVRKIKKFVKKKNLFSSKEFAEKLESILREFLCRRFDSDFNSLTTNQFPQKFSELSCGDLEDEVGNTVENIVRIFERCDYIRFAGGSLDSKKIPEESHQTELGEDERTLLAENSIEAVQIFCMP